MAECEKHGEFERLCGGLEANMQTVIDGQDRLFSLVNALRETSAQYQVYIENLNKLYGNGWKTSIERQITETLSEFKSCIDDIKEKDERRDQKISDLQAGAWFGKFMTDFRDKWFRRTLQIVLGLVLLGVFNNLASATGSKLLSELTKIFGW